MAKSIIVTEQEVLNEVYVKVADGVTNYRHALTELKTVVQQLNADLPSAVTHLGTTDPARKKMCDTLTTEVANLINSIEGASKSFENNGNAKNLETIYKELDRVIKKVGHLTRKPIFENNPIKHPFSFAADLFSLGARSAGDVVGPSKALDALRRITKGTLATDATTLESIRAMTERDIAALRAWHIALNKQIQKVEGFIVAAGRYAPPAP